MQKVVASKSAFKKKKKFSCVNWPTETLPAGSCCLNRFHCELIKEHLNILDFQPMTVH